MDHRAYRATKTFPAIDGLRAVSILLVLTWHVNSALWLRLEGWEGVNIFFVISGFVITKMLLREHERGRVSLAAFYRRRAYRILPVYLVVLGFYVLLVIGANYHHHRGLLVTVMPYYLTFTNDFAPLVTATPFAQTWSLGVEEKFYLVWPLLAFVVLRYRGAARIAAAGVLGLAPFLLLPFPRLDWFYAYAAIMVGCLLALALDHERGYRVLTRLARPAGIAGALALLVVLHVLIPTGKVDEYAYPFAVAAVMVGLVAGTSPLARLLSTPTARLLGRLSYSVYLVHMIVASVGVAAFGHVGVRFDPSGRPLGWAPSLLLLALVTVGSFALAYCLYRLVEQPWIARGRARSARMPVAEAPAAAPVA